MEMETLSLENIIRGSKTLQEKGYIYTTSTEILDTGWKRHGSKSQFI